MARGWAGADGGPDEMVFTDAGSGRAKELADEVDGDVADSNSELAERVDLIVLAMKPAQLEGIATEVGGAGRPIISLLGGTSLARLGEALADAPVVRVMPNVAVEVRRGVLCYAASDNVGDDQRQPVVGLLELLGRAIELDDEEIDAATAIMGCSPAYVALVAEALIKSGVEEGLTEPKAGEMVAETVAGTAELLARRDPKSIREAVASPGGSTEAGLRALDEGEVETAFANAVNASLERMRA